MHDNLPRDRRSRIVSQLGKVSVVILTSLFVVCLGCLVFLAFLWGADENNTVWRSIVLAEWTARSITITSLVLRWATAAQAATCTSMLAAILLKQGAVPLPAAAAVSIIRVDNTGPWSLLGKMEAEWHRGSVLVGLLVALLTFTTLSLQFTSTILLSQVGLASLPVASSVPQTYYGIKTEGNTYWSLIGINPSFLSTTPARYPAFAEWVPNTSTSNMAAQHGFASSNAPGIRDTGTVMRAFLPIDNNEERNRITEYHGIATVVDTRVVCMRPSLTKLAFSMHNGLYVTGLAHIEQKPLGLVRQAREGRNNNFSVFFDCGITLPPDGPHSEPHWALAACYCGNNISEQGIYSVMEPKGKKHLGDSYLLINATLLKSSEDIDDSDVWESIPGSEDSVSARLQLTFCMTSFQAQRMEVDATRSTLIHPEPSLHWNTSTAMWNTHAVLQQLGARTSEISAAERGIFDLAPRSWQWSKYPEDLEHTGDALETTQNLVWVGSDLVYNDVVNSAQYSIFSQMASSTKNPALGLQAFLTTLCSICYYDRIPMFDAVGPSSRVSLVQVIRPLGWTAFIIVAAVAVLHLILVLSVVLMFRGAGNLSCIQNAWPSISQLLGPVTEDWIRGADTVDDKTVKLWLKDRGLHRTLVGVEHIQGRVHLVKKKEFHRFIFWK